MRVTPPITITDAILTSSTAPEPDTGETAWNALTAYLKGDQAYLASNHTVYERLIAGTTANSPKDDPVNWAEVGPTNRWRMFDLLRSTGTTHASPLTVVITPGERVDSVALLDVVADQAVITVSLSGTPIRVETISLRSRNVSSWLTHYTTPFTLQSKVYIYDLPVQSGVVVTVALTRAAGDVSCGSLVIGRGVFLGDTVQGTESDALNFSVITRNDFGDATLTPRRSVPKITANVIIQKANIKTAFKLRDDLNAKPALWSIIDDQTDDYSGVGMVLGPYRRFPITLDQPGPDLATAAIEVEDM